MTKPMGRSRGVLMSLCIRSRILLQTSILPLLLLSGLLAQSRPAITVSSNQLTFEQQVVGSTSSARTLTLTNQSAATVNITGIAVSGADFAQQNTCGALAAGASCTVSVAFSPKYPGPGSSTLKIVHSASTSPLSIELAG